jgi:hypothetical protein
MPPTHVCPKRGMGLVFLCTLLGTAHAVCPPDCVPGGGPPATDCFVAWSGIPATVFACFDGDPSCDTDGKADGTCTLPLQGCINVAGLPSCTPGALTAPPTVKPPANLLAQGLAAALAALDPAAPGCTQAGFAIPLRVSLGGIKPGVAKLTVIASSGGKRDKDKLRLTCAPSPVAPSFTRDVQEGIFALKCATENCHDRFRREGGQSLEPDEAYSSNVGTQSLGMLKLDRVEPGNIRKSYLARKILGEKILGGLMPFGCPGFPPEGGCLTQAEIFTILSWIANGAPNN